MKRIDLHTHTTASDGKCSPKENVMLAEERGLQAIAITDHDTVGGIQEALQAAEHLSVEVIPGIEVSTLIEGTEIHVLGYFIDFENEAFNSELAKLRKTRNLRNEMMVEKLQELGIEITIEEVKAKQKKKGGNVGRPHIAEVLMEKGIVHDLAEAFDVYLGKEGKAYVNPPRISPFEGVALIQKYGGVPVLAHPGLYDYDELIKELVEIGLKGIEVHHPDHSPEEVKKYSEMAKEFQLIATGGSDYHGKRNGVVFHGDLGSQPIEYEVIENLRAVKKS
ncbi:PHP domain-containing protein [Caldalkalibacillus mannanilyticus]|uniref:PHP domain-containing protein n=1 Tax=Caldalkalibacillus mannanilyticus TaxID=1418 RepID=UPI000469817E|nr:PHP domain-containing protein [Caldalkalibacillus mannanilyticus]